MLECRACLQRCLRALSPSNPSFNPRAAAPTSYRVLTPPTWRRSVSTALATTADTNDDAALRRRRLRAHNEVVDDHKRLQGKVSPAIHTAVVRELSGLQDPYNLAERVKRGLERGEELKMEALVRLASKNMSCVVSWNHLISYRLSKKRVSEAMKTYNEMKKRAQRPDSVTFAIIFRGLAANQTPSAVGNALALYHSMRSSKSTVPPNVFHTNSVLNVCAMANDMDALWGVASQIPERGPGAADATTYSTVFKALARNALADNPLDMPAEDLAAVREKAVVQGRRLWGDVIAKWRAGDITVTSHLVCAMGRLLLIGGRPGDWDDILSLIEQTMNIPRQVPRLGTAAREQSGEEPLLAPLTPASMTEPDEFDDPGDPMHRGSEFAPVVARRGLDGISFAAPCNNSLALVMEACLKLVARRAATSYWDIFTDSSTHAVTPDLNNLLILLRILRQARASAAAVDLLQRDIPGYGLAPNHAAFRIAMSTCARDKNNPNALAHAQQLLALMARHLPDPDPRTLEMFLELAADDRQDPRAALRAAESAAPTLDDLRSFLAYDLDTAASHHRRQQQQPDNTNSKNKNKNKDKNKNRANTPSTAKDDRALRASGLLAVRAYVALADRLLARPELDRADVLAKLEPAKKRNEGFLSRNANSVARLRKEKQQKEGKNEEEGKEGKKVTAARWEGAGRKRPRDKRGKETTATRTRTASESARREKWLAEVERDPE